MKIADSLRQECMPEMVYTLCKMTCVQDDREKIQAAICLKDSVKKSQEQFNIVYLFAKNCGFITEQNGKVKCLLDESKMDTFRQFRMQIAKNVFKTNDSKFEKIARWYMGKEDYYIFSRDTADSLSEYINQELHVEISKDYTLGFRFWMADLGFLSFQNYRRGALMFSCHNFLLQWINEQGFVEGEFFPVRKMMDTLITDCPLFESMIYNNHLNLALSMAMRVLKNAGYIDTIRVKDSGDVWHIKDSNLDPWIIKDSDSESRYRNEFSELMIKRR